MEWLSNVLGTAATGAGGAIFGAIGALGGSIVKYFQRKQEIKFQREKWKYETDMFQLQMQDKREEEEHELETISQEGSWSGLTSSIQHDSAPLETHKVINDIKSLFRPFLTTGLIIVTYLIFRDMLNILQDQSGYLKELFEPEVIKDILRYIIHSVVFCASTSVVWWYGDRAFSPPGMKNK